MKRLFIVKVTNNDGKLRGYVRHPNDGRAVTARASRDYSRTLESCAIELAADLVGSMIPQGAAITGAVAETGPECGAMFVAVTFDNLAGN